MTIETLADVAKHMNEAQPRKIQPWQGMTVQVQNYAVAAFTCDVLEWMNKDKNPDFTGHEGT